MKRSCSRHSVSTGVLKKFRVVLAGTCFACTSLVFLDIHDVAPRWLDSCGLYFQFVPSLLHGIRAFGMAATGFIVVLLLTCFFGRIYCSFICPLGILMDIISFFRKKVGRKLRHKYAPPHSAVRYGVLLGTVFVFLSGSMFLINLLDPFSNFGRMTVAVARPMAIMGNSLAAFALERVGYFALAPYPFKGFQPGMGVFTLAFSVFIFWIALTRDRLYCNMICPVGTLLGSFSKAAVLKIRICGDACNGCGRCEWECKSGCIDVKNKRIDHSRCVACFNCLSVCPTGAVRYNRPIVSETLEKKEGVEKGRRRFLTSVGMLLLLVPRTSYGAAPIQATVPNRIRIPAPPHPILPPGAVGINHFTHACTACQACVAHCPTQVLQPSLMEYGLAGLFMPRLDPVSGYCNLNCNKCGEICPTGAIKAFTLEEKKKIQVGVARFVRNNCIVVLQGTVCGACSEHCPTKAVHMIVEGKLQIPEVDEEICLGCGACEHVCPARPNKAIYIKPHAIHRTAKAPASKDVDVKTMQNGIEFFPF